jgi:hypothetical protein
MAEPNTQSLAAVVEETMDPDHRAIEQTRAEIARSQARGQADADLAQASSRSPRNAAFLLTSAREER